MSNFILMINEARIKDLFSEAKPIYNVFPINDRNLKKWADSLEDPDDSFIAHKIYNVVHKRNTNNSTLVLNLDYVRDQVMQEILSNTPLYKS